VYLLANIRGGGEFGPRWHEAGLKANHQRVYDDYIAVAEDAIARKLTSTRDDRVHPGHARKMAAQGHALLYYENIEGGHGGASNNEQCAYMSALAFTFLLKELC
jgi:prolyl oligopeptidase